MNRGRVFFLNMFFVEPLALPFFLGQGGLETLDETYNNRTDCMKWYRAYVVRLIMFLAERSRSPLGTRARTLDWLFDSPPPPPLFFYIFSTSYRLLK